MDNGEPRCIAFGGLRVDDAIEGALLTVVGPGAIAAAVTAEKEAGQQRDQVREALRRDLEAARYAADRAFRQYDAADPANRLVTGELEARWNTALARMAEVEAKIAAHDAATVPSTVDPASFAMLAADLKSIWTDPTTDARLKKRIVRTVIHEVIADIDTDAAEIRLLQVAPKTLRVAAEADEIEALHPLPDGPWIFSRAVLSTAPARAITERARQNPRHPAGSHPDQQSLFSSMT